MNPNHFPVMDWITMGYIYEKLINHDGSYKPTAPWLTESWEYLDEVTVLMKLKKEFCSTTALHLTPKASNTR